MRVENAEHRLGDLGEVVVQLVADARVQPGESVDEAVDVRIVRPPVFAQAQATGNLRLRPGVHSRQPANERQLLIVAAQKLFVGKLLFAHV